MIRAFHRRIPMRHALTAVACLAFVGAAAGFAPVPQDVEQAATSPSTRTMRPVISGRKYAVSTMKQQATEAGVRILEAGGNAFDAAVASQAVLALVDPAMNGYG